MPDQNIHFSFEPLTGPDLPLFYEWFQEPHVQQWWPVPEKAEFFDTFLQRIRSKDTRGFIVRCNGTPIGYIQYYRIDRSGEKSGKYFPELPAQTIGTDQFIGNPSYVGKGYGTLMLKAFIEHLRYLEPTVSTVIVDPDPTNNGAIRCYEKVGFRKVGIYSSPEYTFLLMRYDLPA